MNTPSSAADQSFDSEAIAAFRLTVLEQQEVEIRQLRAEVARLRAAAHPKRQARRRLSDRDDIAEYRLDFLFDALRCMLNLQPVRALPGVYFLMGEYGVVYVGQSVNVATRLGGHADKNFMDVRMLQVDDDRERARLEVMFIKLFRPAYNVTYNEQAAA